MKKWFILTGFVLSLCAFFAVGSWASEEEMTRQEFCEYVIGQMHQRGTLLPFSAPNPFSDTQSQAVCQAAALGFVVGDSGGGFYPQRAINKEEAAVILKRAQDYIVPTLVYDNVKAQPIDDAGEISSWARTSVMMLTMTGTIGGGRFYPKNAVPAWWARCTVEKMYQAKGLAVAQAGVLPKKWVPILMYHTICEPKFSAGPYAYLYVSPKNFEAQVKFLSEQGYTFLFPEELNYAGLCEKVVVITFDDGYEDNYFKVLPILQKYNAKATVYVPISKIGQKGMLSAWQVRALAASGLVRIGSHTYHHVNLDKLGWTDAENELAKSKEELERITGRPVWSVAFPYGGYNQGVLALAKKYYKTGMLVNGSGMCDAFLLPRATVDGAMGMEQFAKITQNY